MGIRTAIFQLCGKRPDLIIKVYNLHSRSLTGVGAFFTIGYEILSNDGVDPFNVCRTRFSSNTLTSCVSSGKEANTEGNAEISRFCLEAITSESKALSELNVLQNEANCDAISRGSEIVPLVVIIVGNEGVFGLRSLLTLFQRVCTSKKGLREFRKFVHVSLFAILHSLLTMAQALL